MALYNLNEALKAKAAEKRNNENSEMALDDVSRVKVLSPGRQVFKRFIRNRLAVFGSVLLIVMFVLCFLGPVVYPYGQKEIFYRYGSQNVNYALASSNTSFTGIVVDSSIEVNTNVNSMMTTFIKTMKASELNEYFAVGEDGCVYRVDLLDDNTYTLSKADATEVCAFGSNVIEVGEFDSITASVKYSQSEELGDMFAMAAKKACKGTSGDFDFNGNSYHFEKGTGKNFIITSVSDGFIYNGAPLGASFELAAENAAAEGEQVFSEGRTHYFITGKNESYTAYSFAEPLLAKVFTTYVIDTYEPGVSVSDEFRANALLNAFDTCEFDADGQHYTIKNEGESIVIYDASSKEFGEFTNFIIRRYNGDDTVEYTVKRQLAEAIENMDSSKQTSLTCALPSQNEVGEYNYDEAGNLLYNDTSLYIKQRDTGIYVVNCDQIIYMIDRFASPSTSHILGTDGDGFDVFARIMYGGRISLMVGFVVVFLETILGVIMGGLAGYYGGFVDNIIMRLVDIFYCLPSTPIMIILGAMMDALRLDTYVRLMIMMAMLGFLGWAGVARLVRGQILSLREQEFMVATEATGIKVSSRIFKHLVPNVMPQLIVSATMGMGGTILTESTLSYLGLGVKHPLATWGTMINSVSSASAMAHYAYIWIPVGSLICLTVIAFNFVGDGLRDAYDPKSKR